jgi:ribosomal protein L13
MGKDPMEVIRKAVMRMLPRNRLRDVSETVYLFVSVI